MLYEAGTDNIPLGKVVAILVEDEDDLAAFKDYKDDAPAAAAEPAKAADPAPAESKPAAAAAPTPAAAAPASKPTGGRVFASPLAQNLAN